MSHRMAHRLAGCRRRHADVCESLLAERSRTYATRRERVQFFTRPAMQLVSSFIHRYIPGALSKGTHTEEGMSSSNFFFGRPSSECTLSVFLLRRLKIISMTVNLSAVHFTDIARERYLAARKTSRIMTKSCKTRDKKLHL